MTAAIMLTLLTLHADPTARILGPATCDLGEQVMLDGSASAGASFVWFAVGPAKDPQVIPIDGGKRGFFTIPPSWQPGKYTFFLAIGGASKVAIARHTVLVGMGPNPNPNPGPNPGPPGPTRFGLQDPIRDKAQSLAPAARNKTPLVSAMLRDVSERLDTVTPTEVDRLFAAAVGDQLSVWTPIKGWLISQIKLLNLQGKIRSRADLRDAYREACAGLDQVKLWGQGPPEQETNQAGPTGESRIASTERP